MSTSCVPGPGAVTAEKPSPSQRGADVLVGVDRWPRVPQVECLVRQMACGAREDTEAREGNREGGSQTRRTLLREVLLGKDLAEVREPFMVLSKRRQRAQQVHRP